MINEEVEGGQLYRRHGHLFFFFSKALISIAQIWVGVCWRIIPMVIKLLAYSDKRGGLVRLPAQRPSLFTLHLLHK